MLLKFFFDQSSSEVKVKKSLVLNSNDNGTVETEWCTFDFAFLCYPWWHKLYS